MFRLLVLVIVFFSTFVTAQDIVRYKPVKAQPREDFDQVLQTQLTLPKTIVNSKHSYDITVYFLIDSASQAHHITVLSDGAGRPTANEVKRMLGFVHFVRTDPDPQMPYELRVQVSGDKYRTYLKQKMRAIAVQKADSSFVVYTRADRSPEYYKDGEEGLKDYLLSNLEYPKLALDKSVEGTVLLDFIVETNGFITALNPKQGLGAGCTDEAVRLMKITKWKPALLNGQAVRYRMNYPITFSLRSVNKDTGFANPTVGQ